MKVLFLSLILAAISSIAAADALTPNQVIFTGQGQPEEAWNTILKFQPQTPAHHPFKNSTSVTATASIYCVKEASGVVNACIVTVDPSSK